MSASGGGTAALVPKVALAALLAILQAAVLASAGWYLGRRGIMTKPGAKMISTLSAKVTIPCLLFSHAVASIDGQLISQAWPMLILPIVYVGVGCGVGWVVVKLTNPPDDFRRGTIASVAFANSTGMPLILLGVLGQSLRYLFATGNGGRQQYVIDPVVYQSVYLITYPIIQWVVGGWLLAPKNEEHPPPEPSAQATSGNEMTLLANEHPAPSGDGGGGRVSATDADAGSGTGASLLPEPLPADSADNLLAMCEGEMPFPERARMRSFGDLRPRHRHQRLRRTSDAEEAHTPGETAEKASSLEVVSLHELRRSWNPTSSPQADDGGALVPEGGEAEMRPPQQLMHARLVARLRAARPLAELTLHVIRHRVLVPPVCGVLLGLTISSTPPFYWLFCGGTYGQRVSAADCPESNAILGFLFQGIQTLGAAAVPINLILLGNSLSKGPNWQALPVRCNVGIVIGRMVVMPAFAIGAMLFIDHVLGSDGLGIFKIIDPFDEVFYLAGAVVAATPTATNMMVMTEIAGGNRAAMATAIFSQYCSAVPLLTLSLTAMVLAFHAYG